MPPPAIAIEDLHKRYGRTAALRGLNLTVAKGLVCGLLGPNGAGKTTAVRTLATLAKPDSGRVTVAGFDAAVQPSLVRRAIGLAGQHAAVDARLTGRENLDLYARLHHLGRRQAGRRAADLLAEFGLAECADRPASTYSGGQRRRLDLAASLLTSPSVLLLDEPTTGLDPASRNQIWRQVRDLADQGVTILLTTQYLDEADQLADEVVVIDHGATIATGPPGQLKAAIGLLAAVTVGPGADLAAAARAMARAAGDALLDEPVIDPDTRAVTALLASGLAPALPRLLRDLEALGVTADDAALRSPTLDEAFLRLTAPQAAAPLPERTP